MNELIGLSEVATKIKYFSTDKFASILSLLKEILHAYNSALRW
jgi:hypothetical protein